MSYSKSEFSEPVYKHFRGKWKELGVEKQELSKIESNEFCSKDLSNKSVIELEEMILRQEKILNNKGFISKLNDKGNKLKKKYEDLQKALIIAKQKTENHDETGKGLPNDSNLLEWNGNVKEEKNIGNLKKEIIEDEDESNPLQLLARHSMDFPEKSPAENYQHDVESSSKLIAKELEKLNIRDEETKSLEENQPSNENSSDNYFGKRLEDFESGGQKLNKRKPFKPNRTLIKIKTCETSVKKISITESLKLLSETHNKNKEKLYSDAVEALQQSTRIGMSLPSSNNLHYRDANLSQHFLDEFDEEEVDLAHSELSEEDDESYES